MEELYNLEISDDTLKTMIEVAPELMNISSEEVREKIEILDDLGCSKKQQAIIIGSNPSYLLRTNEEVDGLINCLKKYGFTLLNILFESNPYILNLDPFEIDNYINDRINDGEEVASIIDDLDSNPYLFNEM